MKMKCPRSSIALVALLSFAGWLLPIAKAQIVQPKGEIVKKSTDFHNYLNGPAEWKLAHGRPIRLRMDGDTTVVEKENGERVYALKTPDYVREAVVSDLGSALLLSIWSSRGSGSNYVCLIRITSKEDGIFAERLWDVDSEVIPGVDWWVAKLGAVSDDGTKLLAEIAESPKGPGRVSYLWQTWEMSPAKRLGIGLTIANGKVGGKAD